MKFINPDKQLTEVEVAAVERELGLIFPAPLRSLFLSNNGADPEPYVFNSDTLHTVVNETLPLISDTDRGTATESYFNLVIEKRIVGRSFFPFAVDAGGDYFFVDCGDSEAPVYFFRSDSSADRVEKIANTLGEFWDALEPEE